MQAQNFYVQFLTAAFHSLISQFPSPTFPVPADAYIPTASAYRGIPAFGAETFSVSGGIETGQDKAPNPGRSHKPKHCGTRVEALQSCRRQQPTHCPGCFSLSP